MDNIEFTLAEYELPWNFFNEVDFSYEGTFHDRLKEHLADYSDSQIEALMDEHTDEIHDLACELNMDLNQFSCGEVEEIDESTGTWGYISYSLRNYEEAREELTKLTNVLVDEFLKGMEKRKAKRKK